MNKIQKGGEKIVNLKDINAIFKHLKKILYILNEIYETLERNKEEK